MRQIPPDNSTKLNSGGTKGNRGDAQRNRATTKLNLGGAKGNRGDPKLNPAAQSQRHHKQNGPAPTGTGPPQPQRGN